MNARFNVLINGDAVTLTLRPGQSLSWYQAERTDEGWSGEGSTWYFDGATINCAYVDEGKDCDGRIHRSGSVTASIDSLRAIDGLDGHRWPLWETEEEQRIYDQYAVAANY